MTSTSAQAPSDATTARTGRTRDDSRDNAILQAALELVTEVGYDRVSMDAIAGRAHASKATIYRRWDSKGDVVAAAIRCRHEPGAQLPDAGSLRADLLAHVREMASTISTEDLGLLTGVFSAMRTDATLAAAVRDEMIATKTRYVAPVFERAAARGEAVKPHAIELFVEVAPSIVMHQLMVAGLPADDAFLDHVVDDVLLPVLTYPLPAASDA